MPRSVPPALVLSGLLMAAGLSTAAQAAAPAPAPAPARAPGSKAAATPSGPPCDQPVRFSAAWFADPEVDNTKSAAELTGKGPGTAGGDATLGHVVVETKLEVLPQSSCQGFTVRLSYLKPVLRVAREFQPGTCAHARVMNHEQTHVRIHRDIARQFRELNYPWPVRPGGGGAELLVYAKQELSRLMRAQELFDSPEEYARNHSVCGGEIARLIQPAAKPARPAAKPG